MLAISLWFLIASQLLIAQYLLQLEIEKEVQIAAIIIPLVVAGLSALKHRLHEDREGLGLGSWPDGGMGALAVMTIAAASYGALLDNPWETWLSHVTQWSVFFLSYAALRLHRVETSLAALQIVTAAAAALGAVKVSVAMGLEQGPRLTHDLYASTFALLATAQWLWSPTVGQRLRWGVATLVLIAALALTLTRGLWVGYVCGLIAMLILHRQTRSEVERGARRLRRDLEAAVWLLTAAGVVGLAGFTWPTASAVEFVEIFRDRVAPEDPGSVTARLLEMEAVWEETKRQPVIGLGLGATFPNPVDPLNEAERHFVHNSYLGMVFRFGLIGLGLYLYVLGRTLGRFVRGRPLGKWEPVRIGVFGALIGMSVTSLSSPLVDYYVTFPFVALSLVVLGRER